MPSIELAQVATVPFLAGTATLATGVGTAIGTPLAIHPRSDRMSNAGRTVAIKITRHALVGGMYIVFGRVDPTDAGGWYPVGTAFSSAVPQPMDMKAVLGSWWAGGLACVVADDTDTGDQCCMAVAVFDADYREIRVDTHVLTSGTMDIAVVVGL